MCARELVVATYSRAHMAVCHSVPAGSPHLCHSLGIPRVPPRLAAHFHFLGWGIQFPRRRRRRRVHPLLCDQESAVNVSPVARRALSRRQPPARLLLARGLFFRAAPTAPPSEPVL